MTEPAACCTTRRSAGGPAAAAAYRNGIGESTVKTHLLRVFAKLGVADRTAAVTSAMRYDLLD
jgi:DNA-binding CsgD family transcriptional regulator